MADIQEKLADILSLLSSVSAGGREVYLVGGTVRDMAVGRENPDVDLAVTGDVAGLAQGLAERLGGTSFVMDAERDVHRVVVKGDAETQIDISPLKGDIEADLTARDFTINAMALPVAGAGGRGSGGGANLAGVIDPYGGMEDIRRRVIRVLGDASFVSDPLRMLRAFRLSQQLGFNIDTPTFISISTLAGRIKDVSAERVRDELYLILRAPGAASTFRRMAEAGLLAEVFPETRGMAGLVQGEPHVYDLLTHSLMAMEFSEKVMEEPGRYFGKRAQELREYLKKEADGGLDMQGLVKLAAFLHDSGKPSAMRYEDGRVRFIGHDDVGARINEGAAERLKLSVRAARALAAITRWHMRPLHMSKQGMSRHALYRYARDMDEDLPGSLVVALSDAFATRGRPDAIWTDVEGVVLAASEYYYGEYLKEKEEPLIRGRDLIETFGLKPGPLFGELIEEVAEKRAEGKINDREEAIIYIKEKIKPLLFL